VLRSRIKTEMLEGRVAIVTGSTSGIGRAIARAFAAERCKVVLNGFGEPAEIEQQRAALAKEFAVEVLYHGADLSQPPACARLVTEIEQCLGRIDILVNNAGIQFVASVESLPPEQWDNILAVNLSAAFHTTRVALPGMRARGWGRLINIASAHGLVASVNKSAYVTSKHGLIGLTKVVALETAQSGITCNAICPGWVRTALVEKQIEARAQSKGIELPDAARELLQEKQPTLRFTTVEQVAAMAVFLCSDAAANVTGASLTIDGGWTAQ
jgi:3-hydroxybutyrate dehydrogenase